VRDSLSVGLAVGSYGVAFGAASVGAGFSPAQSSVSSLLTFTGGTQFAVAGVIAGGGAPLAALGSGYLLGARNTLYALRLEPVLRLRGWRRAVGALLTIDESAAMSFAQTEERLARLAFWSTAGAVYFCWNVATVVGAVGASALGDPKRLGLDAAVPAAFLALLAPRLRAGPRNRTVALVAAAIAAGLVAISPPGVPVLAACFALAAGLEFRRRRRPSGESAE
jgi:predicted branched-subunit amino acid permease